MFIDLIIANFVRPLKINRKLLIYLSPSIIFIVYVIFNSLINIQFNSGYFNHVLSYISSVLFFFIVPLWYFESFKFKYNSKQLFIDICIITLLSSLYACFQFVLNNFFSLNLDDFLYWPSSDISNAMALGQYFRTKSFFAEPGHFALFLECFIPLIYWYFFKKDKKHYFILKKILFFTIIISFILTISAAGFFCLFSAVLIAFLLNIKYFISSIPKIIFKISILIGLLCLLFYYTNSYFPVFDLIFTNSIDKLDSGSSEDRMDRLNVFFNIVSDMNFVESFFGFGPNATVTLGYGEFYTIVLLYPLIFIELGFFGLLFFLSIVCYFIYYSFQIKGNIRFYIQISLISILMHYLFISNYWYPYLWFLGIFIFLYNKYQLDENTNSVF